MEHINEVEVITPTKKRLLARESTRTLKPATAYALDTIESSAEVLRECGGQALLVFRAVIGSYGISRSDKKREGFAIHPDFIRATKLPDRQFRRAVSRLAEKGFIEADTAPGRRSRIRLTSKGLTALAKPPARESTQ